MRILAIGLLVSGFLGLTGAVAKPLRVLVSIKPLHSLVASVMTGVGEPELLIQGAQSPHSFALAPSDAKKITNAEVIFFIGKELETSLVEVFAKLAGDAHKFMVINAPGLVLHQIRGEHFDEAPDTEHPANDHHDENKTTAKHPCDGKDGHDGPDGDGEDGHDGPDGDECVEMLAQPPKHFHQPDGIDPHIWLDPQNAKILALFIAKKLGEIDREHRELYSANALNLTQKLENLTIKAREDLASVKASHFFVLHDGFQYLEKRFDLNAIGALSLNPMVSPGAARVAEAIQEIKSKKVKCLFSEPQFSLKLLLAIAKDTGAKVATLDPIGADIKPGRELYTQLMNSNFAAFNHCLAD